MQNTEIKATRCARAIEGGKDRMSNGANHDHSFQPESRLRYDYKTHAFH
jgi:hypothetical protein